MDRLIAAGLMEASDATGMIRDFDKPAGARCPYQKHHKGCTIYKRRPFGCRVWSCRWLTNDDTAELQRPDRSHYVIDESPDFVTQRETNSNCPVIQVWCDPDYPDAHRDLALRRYLERRWNEGYAALVRFGAGEGAMLLYMENGEWHERTTNMPIGPEHTAAEKHAAIGMIADPGDAIKRLDWALGRE